MPQAQIDVNSLQIPEECLASLADPDFGTPNDINILIGADLFYELIIPGHYRLGKGLPILVNTCLGWILSGVLPESYLKQSQSQTTHSFLSIDNYPLNDPLESLLTKFWSQEEVNDTPTKSAENELAEESFAKTTKILQNGRYQINIPFKKPKEYLKLGVIFSSEKTLCHIRKKI